MNTLSKLLYFALATSLVACNEKVSPELQGAASTSSTGGSSGGSSVVTNPDTFYFQVTNTSDTMLNYRLHKTGVGNAARDCKIETTTALSSNAYRADLSTYDITCFFEAEELSLSYNGLSFAVEASKNTCEYVGYGPFSYFDRMPGSSTQTLYEVQCADDNPPTQANIDSVLSANFDGIPCGSMRNTASFPTADFSAPDSDSDLCAFDYTDSDGPNCDIGTITISSARVVMTDTDNDGNVDTPVPTFSNRTVNCGGQISACIDGPFTNENFRVGTTSGIKVGPTVQNKNYSKEYSYAATFETYGSNRKYINYRRDLASLYIEYGNSDRSGGNLSSSYMGSFGDPIYKYTYNPELMAMYSDNKKMDGTALADSTSRSNASLLNGFTVATPYAAEPYIGLGGFKTNPFYTFYCFDNAFDVKARIRMVVRDWDRVFSLSSSDQSFERISDVDLLPPLAKQDVPYTDEVTGEPDSWNAFNDADDWDDLIDMERDDSGVAYDPSITIWRTYPQPPYDTPTTNGFFNPAYFPAEKE